MIAIFTLVTPSWRMVASSWFVIWKPPSPTTATTSWSGRASLAPTAEGRPKPIVPKPPLVIHWRSPSKG
jgi:hypothetical protein